MTDLCSLTIHEAHEGLKKRSFSSRDIVDSLFQRIEKTEPLIQSFTLLMKEESFRAADRADRKIRQGEFNSCLTGIPVAVKDNICTAGIKTTCSSRMLGNFVPPYDATVIRHLRQAEAVMIGKTNMDEFAMGSSTENSAVKITRNPWDPERTPGGSSGGSAAAVAADQCLAAFGSDTGGSIRQPAACCGIVGIKPTYGLVSRYGLIAFASSLDQIGCLVKDVTDAALFLGEIARYDSLDSTSVSRDSEDYLRAMGRGIRGMRIGMPKEYLIAGIDPEIEKAVFHAVEVWKSQGAEVMEISLPHTAYAVATYYILATAEASSNLERYDGVKFGYRAEGVRSLNELYEKTRAEGFGPEVKRRIMLGTYVLSAGYYDAYYKKAQQVRTLFIRDFADAFQKVDVIVTPTAPTTAFKIGEKSRDPLQMYLSDIFTISANLAGIPAISIPGGISSTGMPIGLQVMGPCFGESNLLRAAYAFEQASGLGRLKPPL